MVLDLDAEVRGATLRSAAGSRPKFRPVIGSCSPTRKNKTNKRADHERHPKKQKKTVCLISNTVYIKLNRAQAFHRPPIYRMLVKHCLDFSFVLHGLQNPTLFIEIPVTGILKSRTSCKKGILREVMESFRGLGIW